VKPTVDVFAPVREVRARGAGRGGRNERIGEDVPFDSAGGLSFPYTFPVDADTFSRSRCRLPQPVRRNGGSCRQVLSCECRSGGVHQVALTFMRSGAVAEVVPQVGLGRAVAGWGPGRSSSAYGSYGSPTGRRAAEAVRRAGGPNGAGLSELSIGGHTTFRAGASRPAREDFRLHPATAKDEEPLRPENSVHTGRRAYGVLSQMPI